MRPPEPRAAAPLPDEPGREPDPPRDLRLRHPLRPGHQLPPPTPLRPHLSPSPDHRTTLRGHPTRTKKTAKALTPPTTAKTTRRRHQVLAAQVSDIIDTHWKQGAGYHTLHKIATQPLSWCPPLSTTNPDKSPTLGHPANHDMHQRTGQRRKAQAHKSHPGYGTQHAAPWVAHLRAFTHPERHPPPHTPPHQTDANKEQPATTPRRHPTRRPPTRQAKPDGPDPEENHHQQPTTAHQHPDTHNSQGYNKVAHQVPLTW